MNQSQSLSVSIDALRRAIQRAQGALLSQCIPDAGGGPPARWNGRGAMDPVTTALALIVRAWIGHPSPSAPAMAAQLLRHQRRDGSFLPYPWAAAGSAPRSVAEEVCATATVLAALNVVPGVPRREAAMASARAFVEQNGGWSAVVDGLARLDFAAVYAAIGGVLPPAELPDVSGALSLFPSLLRDELGARVHVYAMETAMMTASIIAHLKDRDGLLRWIEDHRTLDLVKEFQNRPGDWDGTTTQTALLLAFYHAAGVSHDDDCFTRALAWLDGMEEPAGAAPGERTWTYEFDTDVWCTAFILRSLLLSGVSRREPRVAAALSWLAGCQITDIDQPSVDNRHRGAPLRGGWAFQRINQAMPDCDDSGMALCTLGMALSPDGDDALDPALGERIQASIKLGEAWLRGMQDPCGGWSAFAWGFPEKPAGTVMTAPPQSATDGVSAAIRLLLDPPLLLQDPATEDVTARVVQGLAQIGYRRDDPAVASAVEFLRRQQCKNDKGQGYGWWGRWMVNYLTATSFVLHGLSDVGEDMLAPWIQDAIRWVKSCQNPDGGWGEGVDSYAHPERAGRGLSIPPLTGVVLAALIDAGEAGSPEVTKGIAYLLGSQSLDGTWPNHHWLHVYFPPNLYYYLPVEPTGHCLHALGHHARAIGALPARAPAPAEAPGAGPSPRLANGQWNTAYLQSMRQVADPVADEVVAQVYAGGGLDAVNALFATIVRNDDPVPPGVPPAAHAYFESTAALPTWADQAKIAAGQKLFTRLGWSCVAALFCCSLPCSYCAASGSKVLVQTGGMEQHTMRRVFETAQFVIDVMNEGGLAPGGRGIRSAQKVRLLHAAIRHLTLQKGGWDAAADGVPINQEDEVGTLMTFSYVILFSWGRFGIDVTPEERDAWMHTWNVIGHLLGVREELLPRDEGDGEQLSCAIRASQWRPSPQGRKLMQALDAAIDSVLPPGFEGFAPTMIRFLAGDLCADTLGLPPADWTLRVIGAIDDLAKVADDDLHGRFGAVLHAVAHAMMKGLLVVVREGKQTRFRIPPALIHAWDLGD